MSFAHCPPDISGKALDGGAGVALDAQALLDGLPHALLHDVDVVVVQPQVPHAVLDQTPPANGLDIDFDLGSVSQI